MALFFLPLLNQLITNNIKISVNCVTVKNPAGIRFTWRNQQYFKIIVWDRNNREQCQWYKACAIRRKWKQLPQQPRLTEATMTISWFRAGTYWMDICWVLYLKHKAFTWLKNVSRGLIKSCSIMNAADECYGQKRNISNKGPLFLGKFHDWCIWRSYEST